MRAIVLAGGEGTRLRPLTLDVPKPLVPILGRPFIEYQLTHLRSHGVTAVTLALTRNRHSEVLRQALGDSACGVGLSYAYEEVPLGSGGAIAGAAAGWDEPFLVCNGDIVTDVDLRALMRAHEAAHAELTMYLHPVGNPSAFGVVALNDQNRIIQFVEKPAPGEEPSNLVNAGIWLFQPTLLREMAADRFNRVEDELFPALASSGRLVLGFRSESYWRDIGTPRAYLEANLDILDGRVRGAGARGVLADHAIIEPTARIARSVLGKRTVVGARARIESSVLWEGVHVGAGAVVRESVLADDVVITPGALVEGRYLGRGERI
ncbi:MAG: NDP-sugar synthase [Dehalococcoidia bacterium]